MSEEKNVLTLKEAADELHVSIQDLQNARDDEYSARFVAREELRHIDLELTSQLLRDIFTDEEIVAELHDGKTDMKKRMEILRRAIETKQGFCQVKEELINADLREVYLRNPRELALAFALKRNENGSTYGMKQFRELAAHVNRICHEGMKADKADREDGKVLTFGQLREIIQENGIGDDAYHARTNIVTKDIQKKFETIDFSDDKKARERLDEIAYEIGEQLAQGSQSVRFYVCKYLYFAICYQILQMKKILQLISREKLDEFLNQVVKNSISQTEWSLLHNVYIYIGDVWAVKKEDRPRNTDLKKAVLGKLFQKFMLKGSPQGEVVPGFFMKSYRDEDGVVRHNVLSISELREKAYMFGDSESEWHEETLKQIEELKISDFYTFEINYQTVYQLLFEQFWHAKWNVRTENNEQNKGEIASFIDGVLKGTKDLNRATLLSFLANVKCMLEDPELLKKDPEATLYVVDLWEDPLFLSGTRVDHILQRAGFLTLDEDTAQPGLNELFRKIFRTREGESKKLREICLEISAAQQESNTAIEFIELCSIPTKKYRADLTRRGESFAKK